MSRRAAALLGAIALVTLGGISAAAARLPQGKDAVTCKETVLKKLGQWYDAKTRTWYARLLVSNTCRRGDRIKLVKIP